MSLSCLVAKEPRLPIDGATFIARAKCFRGKWEQGRRDSRANS